MHHISDFYRIVYCIFVNNIVVIKVKEFATTSFKWFCSVYQDLFHYVTRFLIRTLYSVGDKVNPGMGVMVGFVSAFGSSFMEYFWSMELKYMKRDALASCSPKHSRFPCPNGKIS